jgi:hypothetical protein
MHSRYRALPSATFTNEGGGSNRLDEDGVRSCGGEADLQQRNSTLTPIFPIFSRLSFVIPTKVGMKAWTEWGAGRGR